MEAAEGFWDWYQATVDGTADDLLAGCSDLVQGRPRLDHVRAPHGYGTSTVLKDDVGTVATVWHGGTHERPHVLFTSNAAVAGAHFLRTQYEGRHVPTRVDARLDFSTAGAFDRMLPVAVEVARERRIKVFAQGDHFVTMKGRGIELGAKSSAVRMRLYDKAEEQRGKHAKDPVKLLQIPDDWTRLEAQVRPETREGKLKLTTVEPLALFGAALWLREVLKGVVGLELDPLMVTKPFRDSDDERAWAFLLAQYGGLLERRKAKHGSWGALGSQIGFDLVERAIAQRKLQRFSAQRPDSGKLQEACKEDDELRLQDIRRRISTGEW